MVDVAQGGYRPVTLTASRRPGEYRGHFCCKAEGLTEDPLRVCVVGRGMLQQGRGEELENIHEVGEGFNSGLGGIHW